MKYLPDGVAGKALALAILVFAVGFFYLAVVSPVLAFYDDRSQRLEQRAALAERYQLLVRQLPSLQEADKHWRDEAGGELLLEGQSDAIASASLQGEMKSLVEDAGAKLSSAQVLAADNAGRFRRVGLHVVLSGDFKLVTSVFRAMETSRPKLYVGNFDLHAGGVGGSEDDSDSGDAGDGGELTVTMDIYGFHAA